MDRQYYVKNNTLCAAKHYDGMYPTYQPLMTDSPMESGIEIFRNFNENLMNDRFENLMNDRTNAIIKFPRLSRKSNFYWGEKIVD